MNAEELKREKRELLLRVHQINFLLKRGVNNITLEQLCKKVERFTGVDVSKKADKLNRDVSDARELFCRYGFECGYMGSVLSKYMNCERSTALMAKKRNINKCKSIKYREIEWDRFKKFMKNEK